MRFFLAGIMQGSHQGLDLHTQDYRPRIKALLAECFPGADVYDPLADHTNSLDYDDALGRRVFFHHVQLCGQVDVVLAFLPEASMGTAIEMWHAFASGKTVVTISPLEHNWAVKFLSHAWYRDLAEFEAAVRDGGLAKLLASDRR